MRCLFAAKEDQLLEIVWLWWVIKSLRSLLGVRWLKKWPKNNYSPFWKQTCTGMCGNKFPIIYKNLQVKVTQTRSRDLKKHVFELLPVKTAFFTVGLWNLVYRCIEACSYQWCKKIRKIWRFFCKNFATFSETANSSNLIGWLKRASIFEQKCLWHHLQNVYSLQNNWPRVCQEYAFSLRGDPLQRAVTLDPVDRLTQNLWLSCFLINLSLTPLKTARGVEIFFQLWFWDATWHQVSFSIWTLTPFAEVRVKT